MLVARHGRRPPRAAGWLRAGSSADRGCWAAAVASVGDGGGVRVALAAPGRPLQLFACQARALHVRYVMAHPRTAGCCRQAKTIVGEACMEIAQGGANEGRVWFVVVWGQASRA